MPHQGGRPPLSAASLAAQASASFFRRASTCVLRCFASAAMSAPASRARRSALRSFSFSCSRRSSSSYCAPRAPYEGPFYHIQYPLQDSMSSPDSSSPFSFPLRDSSQNAFSFFFRIVISFLRDKMPKFSPSIDTHH